MTVYHVGSTCVVEALSGRARRADDDIVDPIVVEITGVTNVPARQVVLHSPIEHESVPAIEARYIHASVSTHSGATKDDVGCSVIEHWCICKWSANRQVIMAVIVQVTHATDRDAAASYDLCAIHHEAIVAIETGEF